jgi:threonyl-tRNA synthetase
MQLIFPDGAKREFEDGISALEVAGKISQKLKKEALAVSINGETKDISSPLNDGSQIQFLTFEDDAGKRVLRHTASHVLAQAVLKLFPDAKLAIGPAIDNGFYYDFDVDTPFTQKDLDEIEKEMNRIIKRNEKLERFELPREEALKMMEEENEPYKVELISDLPEDSIISFYRQGGFTDLCAGPHLLSTGLVKNVKITGVAGAYWRGSEKNKMLQRIYATAFPTKEGLQAHLDMLEEAKRRDHRKLGRELDLFSLLEEGPGFPFYHPKGMIIRNELENFWREIHEAAGYQEIKTPIMLNQQLWERSGHWDHYRDNMYTADIDDTPFAVKPMNCPGGMLMYKRRIWSYRDLPIRMGELGLVHRHELSGALHGLMRVRCFTQDDAHIFMRPDQIHEEIIGVINLTTSVYEMFGLKYQLELSTRPEDSMGSDEEWEMAIEALRSALEAKNMPYKVNEGDGAFYGPKIDFHIEDSIGRTWQCGTIQLDFQMPERFDLSYVGSDGEKHRPVMIHRVVYGAIERFMAILTEHFAGAFPVWLAPEQARVMTITDRADDRAYEILDLLKKANIRASADIRNEKIGFKIREAQTQKIPFMLVLGDKEVESGVISVRQRGKGDIGQLSVDDFLAMARDMIDNKTLD